jgi:hypothetical protein
MWLLGAKFQHGLWVALASGTSREDSLSTTDIFARVDHVELFANACSMEAVLIPLAVSEAECSLVVTATPNALDGVTPEFPLGDRAILRRLGHSPENMHRCNDEGKPTGN